MLASVLFGAMSVCVRIASREMPAMQIAWVRFAGSLAVLLVVNGSGALRPRAAGLLRLGLRGLLGAVAVVFFYRGIAGAGAALATLLQSTYPIFTALFAVALLDERLSGRLLLALLLNLLGLGVVLDPRHALAGGLSPGVGSALCAAVLSGGAVATARHLRQIEGATVVTTYFMLVGTVTTAPALVAGLPAISPALGSALIGVVLTSVAGQWLLHQGLGFTSATRGSLAAATNVVSAGVIEAAVLGTQVGPRLALGAALMLAAVALAGGRRAG